MRAGGPGEGEGSTVTGEGHWERGVGMGAWVPTCQEERARSSRGLMRDGIRQSSPGEAGASFRSGRSTAAVPATPKPHAQAVEHPEKPSNPNQTPENASPQQHKTKPQHNTHTCGAKMCVQFLS